MFAPCREQTGNPSHKLRRYLGSLFKSRLHYASAGEESLVRFATHIPGDDVGWVCWKRLEGYERDVSNRVRLLSCRVVNLTDGCCFQHQLGRSSITESWIVSPVFAWIGHCWNSVDCKKRGHCREVKLKTTSKSNETMQLINKSIDVLDQYMLPIDRQVHGLKVCCSVSVLFSWHRYWIATKI